ncbi:MAG: hypothetical protein ACRDIC_05775 [bacterium]
MFGITEAGVARRLPLGFLQGYQDEQISLHLGLMRGRGKRSAFGGSVFLVSGVDIRPAEFPDLRLGIAPRVRYWAARRVAVDFLAGPTLSAGRDTATSGHVGFLAETSLSLADWVALTMQVERLPSGPTTWSLGVKAGSYPGCAGIVAFILINLIDEYCGSKPGGCGLGY